jgi:hypothetical protein
VLTLLCPVFCLADAGDECSPLVQSGGDNCEAMTFGAVVEKIDPSSGSADHSLPCLDGLFTPESAARGSYGRVGLAALYRRSSSLPPAANRRRALLQTFLI